MVSKNEYMGFTKFYALVIAIYIAIAPLSKAEADENLDSANLAEAFLYSCSHCFDLEPLVDRWRRNNPDMTFVRIPVVGGDEATDMLSSWTFAKTYYAFEKLGVLESMHNNYFTAIHIERRDLITLPEILKFVAEFDIDPDSFEIAFDSDEIRQKVIAAREYTTRQKLDATPTFIVNDQEHLLLNMFDGNASSLLVDVDQRLRESGD